MKKILIMGLPGSGKTTLAHLLKKKLNAVHFNADEVRQNINKDLGFSVEDRNEQARRMGWLCDQVCKTNSYAIADFVCPTKQTRAAFGDCVTIWMNTVQSGRFEDTNKLFEAPQWVDFEIKTFEAERHAEVIAEKLMPKLAWNNRAPTALLLGRYQPWHEGHQALFEQALQRADQVLIAVRDTQGTNEKNPFDFEFVKSRIEEKLQAYKGRYQVVLLPNITNICYGRDVGYKIEKIDLDPSIESISATEVRRKMLLNK
jgi:cytidyltransferase-like protein